MSFDIAGAKAEGYSDEEILGYLAKDQSFDIDGARKEGYSDPEILGYLTGSAPSAQPAGPQPLISPMPAPKVPFGEKVEKAVVGLGKYFAQHRLKPLAAALATPLGGGGGVGPLHDYIVKNGLQERLDQGMPEDEALNQTIRSNIEDLALTTLDVATLGEGAAIHSLLRQGAAKIGLKGVLGGLSAGAIEAGGYGATYAGISGAIEGQSVREIVQRMGKDAGIGALIGGPIGAAGVKLEQLFRGVQRERTIAEKAAQEIADTPPPQPKPRSDAPPIENPDQLILEFDHMSSGRIPNVPVMERARSIAYAGTPELRPFVRAQEKVPLTFQEKWNNFINEGPKSFFTAEPGATKPVAQAFLQARYGLSTSPERANQIIADRIVSHLQGDIGAKSSDLSDLMAAKDRLSRMKGLGSSGPMGTSQAQWENEVELLSRDAAGKPDVLASETGARNLADEMFQFMVRNGMIDPERYRKDWTPTQQILEMAGHLAKGIENTKVGRRLLSAVEEAESAKGIVRTNIVQLMRDSVEALLKKAHENELVNGFLNDPEINVTHLFEDGQPITKGYKRWVVAPGQAGWQGTDDLTDAFYSAAQGAAKALGIKTHIPGTYIMPEDVVNRLNEFYSPRVSAKMQKAINVANAFARTLTLYNPANRVLNQWNDLQVALMGLEGEKSDVIGFLRFYPRALKAAYRGAFGAENPLYKRAVKEGVSGSTFIQSIGGKTAPEGLEEALAQGERPSFWERSPLHKVSEFVRRERQAGEAAPRIAAGLAAEKRTKNPAQFSRVGHAITLPYGAGDPAIAREHMGRILAPFWRWQGLATERQFRMMATKGSRARGWALLTAPAVAAATWNIRNDEFKKVEYSLPTYLKNHMHVILPDANGHVLRDKAGNPRVWNVRIFLPEEVMNFFGVSNLPGRAVDLASGYTTPGEFAKETATEFGQNVASLPAPLLAAQQLLTGRSTLTGQEMEAMERIQGVFPLGYLGAKTIETARNQGVGTAAKELPERIMGVKSVGAKQGNMDAKLQGLVGQMRDAQMQMRSAAAKGNTARMKHFRSKAEKIGKRIKKLQQTRENQ